MKNSFELITPEIAKELLSHNGANRPLSEVIVTEYARQMAAGLWKEETAESIKISADGRLINGQHRLHAVIKAKVSLYFLVSRELDYDIYKVIDQGKKRSPTDTFYEAGIKEHTIVAGGIRRYTVLKRNMKSITFVRALSNQEALSIYLVNPRFWDGAAENAKHWYKKSRVLTKSDYCGLFALFHDIDQQDAFLFLDSLSSGLNDHPNDPIFMLREKLIGNLISGYKLTDSHRLALIYKAWNYFRKQAKIQRLIILKDEKFPIPA